MSAMDSSLRNLLYTRPELYETVYDGADHAVPRMCERLFERHVGGWPRSLLEPPVPADRRTLDAMAKIEQRREDQELDVRFEGRNRDTVSAR